MEFQTLSKLIYCVLSTIVLALASDEYAKLEDEYVKHFGNDPQNPNGQWPRAKAMAENDTLAEFCSRVHFLNDRTSYENILDAFAYDGTLRFVKTNQTYQPMKITVVNYTSHREKLDHYITRGMRDDCVFYMHALDEPKTIFHLTQHKCDCIFF